MSGGVDSSATAALLKEQGHDVVGITLHLHNAEMASGPTCCGGDDVVDARRVAEQLGILHYVLDFGTLFRTEVIEPFVDSYARGETPIPCIHCNQTVKFRDLMAAALQLGAEAVATGHYVRRIQGPEGPELHRAIDHARDQSYFLFTTTRDQLALLRFPLGAMTKDETRAIAVRHGLSVATKPASQDICFIPDGDYGRLVRKLRPEAAEPGNIVNLDGRILGHHEGLIHFTVGQRRGLRIGGNAEPLYVIRLDPNQRQVVVGPRPAVTRDQLDINVVNWLGEGDEGVPMGELKVMVKLRSHHPPIAAVVSGHPNGTATVILKEPFMGVAPGQACVFYQNERVLGGGWILRDDDPRRATT